VKRGARVLACWKGFLTDFQACLSNYAVRRQQYTHRCAAQPVVRMAVSFVARSKKDKGVCENDTASAKGIAVFRFNKYTSSNVGIYSDYIISLNDLHCCNSRKTPIAVILNSF